MSRIKYRNKVRNTNRFMGNLETFTVGLMNNIGKEKALRPS